MRGRACKIEFPSHCLLCRCASRNKQESLKHIVANRKPACEQQPAAAGLKEAQGEEGKDRRTQPQPAKGGGQAMQRHLQTMPVRPTAMSRLGQTPSLPATKKQAADAS